MNLKTALTYLAEGKKIRHPRWAVNDYIVLDSLGFLRDEDGSNGPISFLDDELWELFDERSQEKRDIEALDKRMLLIMNHIDRLDNRINHVEMMSRGRI